MGTVLLQPTPSLRAAQGLLSWCHSWSFKTARLLRFLPDPACTYQIGSVDPPKTTLVSLAAVAERAQPLQRTAPSWRPEVQRRGCRRFTAGVLAHVRTPGGPTGPAQPLFG